MSHYTRQIQYRDELKRTVYNIMILGKIPSDVLQRAKMYLDGTGHIHYTPTEGCREILMHEVIQRFNEMVDELDTYMDTEP